MSQHTATPIRTVMVGCGVISRTHVEVIATHPDLELVAIVDEVEAASTALADHYVSEYAQKRPQAYTTLAAALAENEIDLVTVGVPSGLHARFALEALAAGKHVIIEKPLDVTLSRAREVMDAATSATERGQITSVISQNRFNQSSEIVAAAIAKGRFGRLTSAVASVGNWRSQSYYDSGNWRGTWALDGGGALMNQGVHTVDLLLSFFGRPVEISAHAAVLAHERIEVEDTAVATIRFESGALAVLHATTAAFPGMELRIQIHGSQGSAVIAKERLEYFHAADANKDLESMPSYGIAGSGNQAEDEIAGRGDEVPAEGPSGAHRKQYDDILKAIATKTAPRVGIAEATLALATVRAVYISTALGKPVLFEDVIGGAYDDVDLELTK